MRIILSCNTKMCNLNFSSERNKETFLMGVGAFFCCFSQFSVLDKNSWIFFSFFFLKINVRSKFC